MWRRMEKMENKTRIVLGLQELFFVNATKKDKVYIVLMQTSLEHDIWY